MQRIQSSELQLEVLLFEVLLLIDLHARKMSPLCAEAPRAPRRQAWGFVPNEVFQEAGPISSPKGPFPGLLALQLTPLLGAHLSLALSSPGQEGSGQCLSSCVIQAAASWRTS